MNLIDKNFGVREPHKGFLERPSFRNASYLHCLGGVAFSLYAVLVLTGMLLSFHYVPSEAEAFRSVLRITREVRLGSMVRAAHARSADFLILFIILHTIRVFVHKAYRRPRELNWIAGSLTLIVALASGFTGYLLPWDQKAYWATVVGTNMAATVPLIGEPLLHTVRGGAEVGGPTLARFYSLHVVWLPFIMTLLLWAHFHMVRKQGIAGGL